MENEFVTYEQALSLKELGFNEKCLDFYDDNKELFYNHENKEKIHIGDSVKAPLKQQVFRWFREKYSLEIILCPDCFNEPSKLLREYKIISIDKSIILDQCTDQKHWIRKGCFVSYEEAESACIDKLIEIVKQQKDGK